MATPFRQWLRRHPALAYPALGLIAAALLFALLDRIFPLHLPEQDQLYARVVVDKIGRPLRAFPDASGVWRYEISLDEVSPLYLEALLAYEDRRFWHHPGIDPVALVRAAASNWRHSRTISGGSTITMQVARLLHPHSRSIPGKLHQMFRALQLERHLDKREILTLYCNIAPFGGTIEGVQAASFTYLNKPARDLTHAEAALLAVLPQSPTRYRPDLAPALAQQARDKVLDRMVTFGHWPQEQVDAAKLEPVQPLNKRLDNQAALLAERLTNTRSQRVVHSTIDADLQASLEDYLRQFIATQPERTSAAVLVVDNATSEVRAYLGAADFGNLERFGHVDMVRALRSPGSTLKPFLYGLALDAGLIHSQSLLIDAPLQWQEYQPANFSGAFVGPVSAAEALQRSLNVPAVDLLDRYGPEQFVARLANAGLDLSVPGGKANLAVILGGAGTNLEKLVVAYSALANGGKTRPLRFYADAPQAPEAFLVSPEAAWIVYDMLSGVAGPDGLRRVSAMVQRPTLAWKTGTSYGMRDAWAIGIDRRHTIGVWVGRPDNSAMAGNTGRDSAGPLLHTIADHLGIAAGPPKPPGVEPTTICWPLGTDAASQPAEFCHRQAQAWTIKGTVPPTWADRQMPLLPNPLPYWQDPNTNKRVHSGCLTPGAMQKYAALWPSALEPWLPRDWRRQGQLPALAKGCDAIGAVPVKIEQIAPNTIYRRAGSGDSPPRVPLLASGGEGRYHWYVDGRFLHSSPPTQTLELVSPGTHQILVVDDAGNLDKIDVTLEAL
jgi:penicillin-binding protein 1C